MSIERELVETRLELARVIERMDHFADALVMHRDCHKAIDDELRLARDSRVRGKMISTLFFALAGALGGVAVRALEWLR